MGDFFNFLILNSVVSGFIVSGIVYLAKRIIEQFLNKDLEKFKNNLVNENKIAKLTFEKDIESFRADLNLMNSKQIQLYSKKSDIIEMLYFKLVDLNDAMVEMTHLFKTTSIEDKETFFKVEKERIDLSATKGNEFLKYYRTNKIYFDKEICHLIEELQNNFLKSFNTYSIPIKFGIPNSKLDYESYLSAYNTIRDDIPPIMNILENEFRKILGVLEFNTDKIINFNSSSDKSKEYGIRK